MLITIGLGLLVWTSLVAWSALLVPTIDLTFSKLVTSTFIGCLPVVLLYTAKEWLGLDEAFSYGILGVGYIMPVLRKSLIEGTFSLPRNPKALVALGALFLLVILPVFLHTYYVGGDVYSAGIYNVDNAYFMQFVHGFATKNAYPPAFLLSVSEGINYHYGSMLLAGWLVETIGVEPHQAYLQIVPLAGCIILLALLYRIFRNERAATHVALLGALVFVLGSTIYFINYLSVPSALFNGYGRYFAQAVQQPTLYGINLLLLTVIVCQRFQYSNYRIVGIFALLCLPLFKMPYAPLGGIAVGIFALYTAYVSRKWQPLLVPIIGALGMMLVYYTAVFNSSLSPGIEFKAMGLFRIDQLVSIIIFLGFGGLLLVLAGWKRFLGSIPPYLFGYIVPLLLVGSVIAIGHRDGYQIAAMVPAMLWLTLLVTLTKVGIHMSPTRRRMALGLSLASILVAAIGTVGYTINLVQNPAAGYEYVDNSRIVPALSVIPVASSVIATNDLRYPAEGFIRDNRQFQVSAVAGHACFNCEMTYALESVAYMPERRSFTDLLQAENFEETEIDRLANQFGITHLLIHKSYKHAERIPKPLIFEDEHYAVYTLAK